MCKLHHRHSVNVCGKREEGKKRKRGQKRNERRGREDEKGRDGREQEMKGREEGKRRRRGRGGQEKAEERKESPCILGNLDKSLTVLMNKGNLSLLWAERMKCSFLLPLERWCLADLKGQVAQS